MHLFGLRYTTDRYRSHVDGCSVVLKRNRCGEISCVTTTIDMDVDNVAHLIFVLAI